jgi:hypothetical protein
MRRAASFLGFKLLDELLPFPPAHGLDLLFPTVGRARIAMPFKVYEIDDVITGCIALGVKLRSVLMQPTLQLVRDSGVEESSMAVAEDVDVLSLHELFDFTLS